MINRLIINGEVKFDLTDSTVSPSSLLKGYTAYNSNGEMIEGTAESGGSSGNPFTDYLREPVATDIDHSINKITSVMEEGTVETTFEEQDGLKTITSLIVPNDGTKNYVRTTTITDVDQVTEVRESLSEVDK